MLRDRFLDHLALEKRCSPHTVAAYGRDLDQFAARMAAMGVDCPEKAGHRQVRLWLMGLLDQGLSARTVNRKLSALRAFFRFARLTGTISSEPTSGIEPPKAAKRLPEFVEEGRMNALLDATAWPAGEEGRSHRLVIALLYGTGMRLAELLGLRVADADLAACTLRVVGKRNKERLVPIAGGLARAIQAHLDGRRAAGLPVPPDAPLVAGPGGKALSRRSVQRLVAHYLGGVTTQSRKSPHVLRHTFATHMLEHGADLNAVKEILGHAGLAATQVYTHNTVEKLRKVHAKAHPRGGG